RGAVDLLQDKSGTWVLDTALGFFAWQAEGDRFVPFGRRPEAARYSLGSALPRAPSAAALAEGRAFVHEGRYFELRAVKGLAFRLIRGTFAGKLTEVPVPALSGCRSAHLAGSGPVLVAVCVRGRA